MKAQPIVIDQKIRLKDFDPAHTAGLDKEETKPKTALLARRIGELQEYLYAHSDHAALLLFQGMDASGKDGAVRSVLESVNPAGVETANFKAPSIEERAHDYLWRVHQRMPRYGHIGVFNRSHYEAVLAERVLKIVPTETWEQRYQQIVDFEKMLAANNVVILKFYLHISKKEQADRFKSRLKDAHKNWKFSEEDLASRKSWSEYMRAYEDMLNKTSHPAAPWHVVPADHKWFRNYVIADAVVTALEKLPKTWPKRDLSKVKVN